MECIKRWISWDNVKLGIHFTIQFYRSNILDLEQIGEFGTECQLDDGTKTTIIVIIYRFYGIFQDNESFNIV